MSSKPLSTVEESDYDVIQSHEDSENSETAVTIERSTMHIGPIPSPEVLAEYNQIDPTFANRILVMAEQQALHRQNIENKIISSGTRDSLCGIIFGFLIGITALIVALILGLNGRTIESAVMGVGGIGGLTSVFIYGTRDKVSENNEKDD